VLPFCDGFVTAPTSILIPFYRGVTDVTALKGDIYMSIPSGAKGPFTRPSSHLALIARQGGAKFGGEVFQSLGDDHGIGEDRHEIGVAEPARDDVDV
jgi:hypothetical protein